MTRTSSHKNIFQIYLSPDKLIIALIILYVSFFTSCSAGKNNASTEHMPPGPPIPEDSRIPGEYLVKLTRPDPYFIKNYFSTYSIEFIKPIGGKPNTFHIKIHPDPGPEVLRKNAAKEERIQSIEPNVIFHLNEK